MEIIEDTISAAGMHDLRILLDDGRCMFVQYKKVPDIQEIETHLNQLLANQEFEHILKSDAAVEPVHMTKEEFSEKFRERYQFARGDEALQLSHWLANRIDDGTFTDKQTLSVENTSLKELIAIKEKLQENQEAAIEVLEPKEEEPIKEAEPVVGK